MSGLYSFLGFALLVAVGVYTARHTGGWPKKHHILWLPVGYLFSGSMFFLPAAWVLELIGQPLQVAAVVAIVIAILVSLLFPIEAR